MDEADQAKDYELRDRAAALAAALARPDPEPAQFNDHGERIRLDCHAVIPQARLEAYPQAVRCVPCKAARERRHG